MPALKHLAHLLASLAVTVSRNWNRPVAELLRERWPVTAQLMGVGILGGWALALAFALPAAIFPSRIWNAMAAGLIGLLCACHRRRWRC
jgi:ABC-type dipeptide/oligopeptide/nickel transport system permease component